jgi:galactosylceramide sulfotransferase
MTKHHKHSGEVRSPKNDENSRNTNRSSSSKEKRSSKNSEHHQSTSSSNKTMRSKSTHHQNYTSSNTNSINHGQLSNTHSTNSHPRLTERYSIDSIINNSKNSAIIIPKDVHNSSNSHSNNSTNNKRTKSRFAKISYGIGSVSIGIMFLLGFVVHQRLQSNNINSFSSSNSRVNLNGRYIRSVHSSNQDSDITNLVSTIRQLNNDISLLYREYVSPVLGGLTKNSALGTSSSGIGSSSAIKTPLSSSNSNQMQMNGLSGTINYMKNNKNAKLHFEPDSKASSAHHVLEGEGFRLNIPSYVESIPASMQNSNGAAVNVENQQNKEKNYIQNDKFDKDILNFDINQKKLAVLAKNQQGTFQQGNQLSDNYLPKKSVTQEEIPLSQSDPELSQLIKNIIDKNMADNFQTHQAADIHNTIVNHSPKSVVEMFQKNSDSSQCQPSKNMVFAKTHKTGGTTVTNMLLRHAEKYNLDVALPIEYHWELGGYPANFDKELVTPKQQHYNLIAHHMRFNKTAIQNLVNPTSDYFTILRDPASNFESSFGFFKDYPFTSWLDENRNINDFIDNPEALYNKNTPWYFRAKNYMSFDLGFNHEDNSNEYISYVINEMEKDFKYVMITDRYEESMILLKNMLCLDYDDIVYLPLKVRTDNDRKILSPEASAKIKKWNRLDTAIYEYYSQKFEQLTVLYGKEKLAKEVKILQEKLKDVEARCVEDYDSQSLKPWIKRIKLRKPSGQKCQRMVWGEVKYADYLRQLQYGRMTEEEYSEQPPLDQKIELMRKVQATVLGDIV